MTIEELKAKAEELKIDFDDETSEEDLQEKVDDKEKEIKKAEDEKKKKEDDVDYWKSEAKKVIEQRDTAKTDARTLKSKIKKLEDQIGGLPDADTIKKLEKELKDLGEFKKTIDAEKEEEENKNKTEIEKLQVRSKKEIEEVEAKHTVTLKEINEKMTKLEESLNTSQEETKRFRSSKLESEIVNVAAKLKAYTPSQIYTLMKDKFVFDKDLDRFILPMKDEKGKLVDEKSVVDAVTDFLGKEENDNLVESAVNTGGLHTRESREVKGSGKKRGIYDPKDPELIKEADLKGLEVEDLIDINIKRDKRLGLNKEEE
jgi:DNA repair exonuclease SbcCD ATPase subunit